LFYLMAFDHLVGYHVLSSTTPNTHYRFGHQLDQCELKYTLSI
jgi:hypothetical protein